MNTQKPTLALDTATLTGWAIRVDGTLYSGTQNFQHDPKRESPGMRFLRFAQWLSHMIEKHDVGLVVYEQPHQRGGGPTTVGIGLVSHLQSVCAKRDVEHQVVHSAQLKKFATGKGNAKKDEMVSALADQLNREFPDPFGRPTVTDDNEADAIWLLLYSEAPDGHPA